MKNPVTSTVPPVLFVNVKVPAEYDAPEIEFISKFESKYVISLELFNPNKYGEVISGDKFINETESSIEFTLVDVAGNEIKVSLPRVKYNGGQPDTNGDGPITIALPFQALYDETEESQVVIEFTAA